MRIFILICLVVVTFIGCNRAPEISHTALKSDTLVIIHRDTVFVLQQPIPTVKQISTTKHTEVKPTPKKEVKPLPRILNTLPADTTFNYYVNKSVSAKTTPWVNDERWVLLYNLQGAETYRHQDVRKSFSIIAHLNFHPNGAVSQMKVSENPGASMYWYETTITFSTTNDPEQKTSERKPYEELTINKPWEYWDSKTKQWKKQQVME